MHWQSNVDDTLQQLGTAIAAAQELHASFP
jgi:hypothetical protein